MTTPNDETVRFAFEHPVAFTTLDDRTVEVDVTELVADGAAVVLTGTVPLSSWEELFEAGVFHLDDEPAPAGFEPELPVRLRLRLRRQVITRFAGPEELLHALIGGEDRALLSTEAWFALEAMQRLSVPGQAEGWVDIGIRTSYAER